MYKVVVHFNSTLHHFSQLLAGLEILSKEKKIVLSYNLELDKYPIDIFRIEFNGLNVFFDLADNSRIYKTIYEQSDFYVKRMLLKTDFGQKKKLVPYGLYYPVYFQNPSLKWLFLQNFSLFKYALKYWKFFSGIMNVKDSIAVNELSRLESKPCHTNQVIFRARLWNPGNNDTEWKKKERIFLNQQRIDINRLLIENYSSNFKGGILRDAYSEEVCPDILLPENEYHRKVYLKEVKNSSIGIVNHGLEDSIGAKMGEYVANGLCVLTTSIDKYKLPGNFIEGQNYLSYETAEDCLKLTSNILEDLQLRENIQENNAVYYEKYLHPAKKIQIIIDQIIK
ncbi:hypothetical protein JM83_0491 [Gillisia sp. Hel_I_86]|uniref:hypothetical protein n=1 Tax=Gillisia sp. Hel_I_86 TaxID=1249981 RepID=UPI00119AAC1B|nr:hypothetical protein [Gillisia sp. Hel_I_86]TVZ25566.1 hypothetical protein JM83_0491 [Gillisia sp. Hel_I_86]